jgi:tetratricopeptide (TPR) repeat protein
MSYINDALKKAQQERDERYGPLGGIITPASAAQRPARRRRVSLGAALLVSTLVLAGLATAVLFLPSPSVLKSDPGSPGDSTLPAVEGAAAAPFLPAEAVPAATAPAGAPAASAPSAKAGSEAARLAEASYREGLQAQRRGELGEAEARYQEALRLDPAHVRALNNAGVLYMEQKRHDQAAALFRRATVLRKDYVDPYYNLACLHARSGDIEESLRWLKAALAIDRDVKSWAEKDADMKPVVASDAYKTLMGGLKK